MKRFAFAALFVAAAAFAQEAKKPTIVKAGSVGELSQLSEANEIRVVFSEPMVTVGKIPKNLTVPSLSRDRRSRESERRALDGSGGADTIAGTRECVRRRRSGSRHGGRSAAGSNESGGADATTCSGATGSARTAS